MTRATLLVALVVGAVTGCRDPQLKDGFPCSTAGTCPAPFTCAADKKCYRQPPNLDGGNKDTGANPDMTSVDPDGGGSGGSANGGTTGSGGSDPGTGTGGAGGASNPGTGGSGVIVMPGSVENGQPCSKGGDCKSTFCAEGVCCSAKCDGACVACAEAYTGMPNGTCGPAKDGMDPHDSCTAAAPETCGNDGQCNGMGACRKHGSNVSCTAAACSGTMFMPGRTCDGAGTCAPSTAVSCGTFPCTMSGCAKPCTDAAECGTGNYCAAGTCKVRKTNGDTCSAAGECGSNFCVDGVCCDVACTGACQACSEMATGQRSGRCQPVQAGLDPDNECPTDPPAMCGRDGTCDGSGACRKYGSTTTCAEASCSGTMYTPARKCAAGACAPATAMNCGTNQCAVEGCRQGCSVDMDCSAGAYCAAGSCAAKKGNGATCTAGNECSTSACIDGVCCETGCTGKCYACSMAKTGQASGKCAAVTAGTDLDNECADQGVATCGTDGTCNGSGACRMYASGRECAAGMCNTAGNFLSARTCDGLGTCSPATTDTCAPNVCAATGCSRTCTMDAQCVGSTYCNGTTCAAKKTTGTACTAANQCATGNCVDGFCCDGTCTGKCYACSMAKTGQANGKCAPVPAGQDMDAECADQGAASCGTNGWCNGSGACQMYPSTQSCGTAKCDAPNNFTPAGMCDGAGACTPNSTRICSNGFTCASTSACNTACTTANAATTCGAGNYCLISGSTSSCAPKKGPGVTCTSGPECGTGICSGDGHCCDVACNASGGCQSCGTGKCTTAAGMSVCGGTCVNVKTDPMNCNGCGTVCSPAQTPHGSAYCDNGQCALNCTANYLLCYQTGLCELTTWNFDDGVNDAYINNSSEVNRVISTALAHSGTKSTQITAATGGDVAEVYIFPPNCDTMTVDNKTATAWVRTNADWGSLATPQCRYLYYNPDSGETFMSPFTSLTKNAWTKVSYKFPSTSYRPNMIQLDCHMPPEWNNDSSKHWYVDDISVY